jgi:hypothetical protein
MPNKWREEKRQHDYKANHYTRDVVHLLHRSDCTLISAGAGRMASVGFDSCYPARFLQSARERLHVIQKKPSPSKETYGKRNN